MASGATTINAAFQESAAKWGAKTALMHKEQGAWRETSYADLARKVEQFASGLASLGVTAGDRVAILSENRPEWVVADLAALALGAITVPIYATLPTPQVAYILKNSGAKALVLSDSKQLAKALDARTEAPGLTYILTMDAAPPAAEDGMVHTVASVLEKGAANPLGGEYEKAWKAVKPEDVASLVYTSGTTGDPKGAMLTHWNFVSNIDAALEHFRREETLIDDRDTFLSFLPLSHVFERTAGYYLAVRAGGTVAYTESLFKVRDNLAEIKPTLMFSTPRLFEAMQERMLEGFEKDPKRDLIKKALAAGREYADRRREGRGVGIGLLLKHALLDKLVLSKIREKVFGGRLRFFVSGGAALGEETARFFGSLGVPILEGYGMTESSPVIAVNTAKRTRIGTVGPVIPGVQVKIAGDGEILAKGDLVMKGYWENPTATAEMIDRDGWLHTGDIGLLDPDGFLKITDRKKDILVLANGKNVAPQPIEAALKASVFINEIVLIGDRQSVVTALVVPAFDRLKDWAKKGGLTFDGDEGLVALPEVRRKIKQEIDANSAHLADYEKIKKFTVVSRAFSVDSGELTPTLKIKRKVIAQKFAREIAEMSGETAVAA